MLVSKEDYRTKKDKLGKQKLGKQKFQDRGEGGNLKPEVGLRT
jgi:hypothetical protein